MDRDDLLDRLAELEGKNSQLAFYLEEAADEIDLLCGYTEEQAEVIETAKAFVKEIKEQIPKLRG